MSDTHFYCTALFIYKSKHNFLPQICTQFLSTNNSIVDSSYNFRIINEYVIPFSRTNMRVKCMNVRGPKLWTNLPDFIRNAPSVSIFKNTFFSFVLSQY